MIKGQAEKGLYEIILSTYLYSINDEKIKKLEELGFNVKKIKDSKLTIIDSDKLSEQIIINWNKK